MPKIIQSTFVTVCVWERLIF